MGRPSRFPEEFRREAVRLVITTDRPVLQVAKELGDLREDARQLGACREGRQGQSSMPGALSENEREELRRLRSENPELKLEREILRKAAAYFAKETTR